ncbi:unnamed protein product [Alternaria alternata]
MVTPTEEEQLREFYYICCRNEGCTINEASERSLEYIKQIHNAEMSLTTTAYLEESSYRPGTHPPRESYYTTEDRQPPSAYDSYASASTYSSYPPVPDDFEPYASPGSRTTDSRPSFCSGARPFVFYTRRQQPPPRFTFYSAFESSNNSSHDQTPPSSPYTRPSPRCRPVPPRPEGVQPTTDLYTVLGITQNATAAEIRKAHRDLSLRWHPDRRTEQEQKEATEKMAEINQANDVLCNEVKRRFYDRWGVLPSEE